MSNENGILIHGLGHVLRLKSRRSLESEEMQSVLKRAHGTSDLVCLCRWNVGQRLVLRPRLLPDGRYVIVRDRMDLHADDCWLRRAGEASPSDIPSSGIFDLTPDQGADFGNDDDDRVDREEGEHGNTASFPRFARWLLSSAIAEATWVGSGRGLSGLAQPTPLAVCSRIDDAVKRVRFSKGENGYQAAADAGGRFRFGLVFSPLSKFAATWNVYWSDGRGFNFQYVAVVPELVEHLTDAMTTFGRVRSAPYLIFAVQDSAGVIQRAWMQQLFLGVGCLLPVDSSYEANYAHHVRQSAPHAVILKPVRMAHSVALVERASLDFVAVDDWKFRPDFLIVHCSTAMTQAKLFVREVRGFTAKENPQYDEHLMQKLEHYRGLYPDNSRCVEEVNGRALPPRPTAPRPESWGGCRVKFGGVSPHLLAVKE